MVFQRTKGLTGKEELGDERPGSGVDDIVRPQEGYQHNNNINNENQLLRAHSIQPTDQRNTAGPELTVLNGLLNTHPRPLLILQDPQRKRERPRLLLHLRKDLSRSLHLELIIHLRVSLVNRRPALFRLGFPIRPGHNKDIYTPDFALFEGLGRVVPSLFGGGVEDDPFGAVGDVLRVGAGEHAFDGDTGVVFGDLLDDVGYGKVLGGGFDRSHLRGLHRSTTAETRVGGMRDLT
jgi:hypothetical protein